jgi:hypothetical protein
MIAAITEARAATVAAKDVKNTVADLKKAALAGLH